MPRQHLRTLAAFCLLMSPAAAQDSDIRINLTQGERPVIALPDFRGSGDAQAQMDTFNSTLFADLQESGYFTMAPKFLYPSEVPQRPEDFKAPLPPTTRPRRGQPPPEPVRQGPWLTDWSNPPVSATYLTIGYGAVQNDRLVLFGWLYNVSQPDLNNAQVFGKLYFGTVDAEGARSVAHQFAADILSKFGATSLAGTKIYFTRRTGGIKEIWVMDYDGSNQRQLTHLGSTTNYAAVSPDGRMLAFMTYAKVFPSIMMMSMETGRFLPFLNQPASLNSDPSFTPDGKQIVFASTAAGGSEQIYTCNIDGSGLRRISHTAAIEAEPEVNPKTGNEMVMTSGRSGPPQVYKMNMDGADVVRLTTGEGDAVNPAWHPDGQLIAFSWTKGYDPGNYNIFIMDVATRQTQQLTHGQGRNENPYWAPDGRHLVFSSNRSGSTQIWTMLADGTQVRQVTTQGENMNPVWSK